MSRKTQKRKTQKFRLQVFHKEFVFDVREILAIVLGFILAMALISAGDLETGRTLALALVFYGIGRSTK